MKQKQSFTDKFKGKLASHWIEDMFLDKLTICKTHIQEPLPNKFHIQEPLLNKFCVLNNVHISHLFSYEIVFQGKKFIYIH